MHNPAFPLSRVSSSTLATHPRACSEPPKSAYPPNRVSSTMPAEKLEATLQKVTSRSNTKWCNQRQESWESAQFPVVETPEENWDDGVQGIQNQQRQFPSNAHSAPTCHSDPCGDDRSQQSQPGETTGLEEPGVREQPSLESPEQPTKVPAVTSRLSFHGRSIEVKAEDMEVIQVGDKP